MTTKITRFFLVTSLAAMANNIAAQEAGVDWIAGFAVGAKNIAFEEHRDGVIIASSVEDAVGNRFENDRDYDETLFYGDFSFGAAFRNFYIAANLEVPFADTDYDESLVGRQGADRVVNIQSKSSGDLSRFDYALTFGYNMMEGVAVFAGYKFGETELTFDKEQIIFLAPGSPTGSLPQNIETTYEEKGFFLGGSYALNVAEAGVLSFSIAYADLDAEYSESGDFGKLPPPGDPATFLVGDVSYDGDANGFSYGLKWSGRLTTSIQYNVGLKYQKYELDGKGGRSILENPGTPDDTFSNRSALDLDTTEEITTLSAGLAYIF